MAVHRPVSKVLFINYTATFEHIDPLGNPRLSLIQGVEIHQMVHMVQAPGAWDDGQPDFLTVEMPNYLYKLARHALFAAMARHSG